MLLALGGCGNKQYDVVVGGPPDLGFGPPPVDLSAPTCESAMPVPPNDAGVPSFGDVVEGNPAPLPVSGGTLLATRDGKTLAASDPDRNLVSLVDVGQHAVRTQVVLSPGDEPGRLAEDGAGRIHVALRSGGAVVTFTTDGAVLERRPVCALPRGIAWDPAGDLVHVACAGGELVSLPAAGGAPTRVLALDRDLRDVVVEGDKLLVSRFRSAELLVIDAGGQVIDRMIPPNAVDPTVRGGQPFAPAVAWRTIHSTHGGALMLHQRGQETPIAVSAGGFDLPDGGSVDAGMMKGGGEGYGGVVNGAEDPCNTVVHATTTQFDVGGAPAPRAVLQLGPLPVDAAFNHDGSMLWVVSAGEAHRSPSAGLVGYPGPSYDAPLGFCQKQLTRPAQVPGQAVAVAVLPDDAVVVQTRAPAALQFFVQMNPVPSNTVPLGDSLVHTGHDVFHSSSGTGIACASCHPEGGEDGRTWRFDFGARRTQSLRGGVSGRAPFHWSGDLPDLNHLIGEVFVRRMSGPMLDCQQVGALQRWLDTVPQLPAPSGLDPASVARGKALFDGDAGCAACHAGALFTNNAHSDVGTGGAFQVPSLRGVAWRAPYLHDGCAPTLRDRFGACGGAAHGSTAQLTDGDVADLVTYLESL